MPTAAFTAAVLLFSATGGAPEPCRAETVSGMPYVFCEFHPERDDIRLFLNDGAGAPFGDFESLAAALAEKGETLVFAMNAGMYRKDRSPVGLYIEDGVEARGLSTKDGPGNFHLKPNGVFVIDDSGGAQVLETADYVAAFPPPLAGEQSAVPRYATQSGPMLVIDGDLHPKFLADSTSRKYRNGVGVREDGTVIFAISDAPVTFHQFASYFRDSLKTPDALYLDGTISRLYAPALDRNDSGLSMGPIVGVVAPKP